MENAHEISTLLTRCPGKRKKHADMNVGAPCNPLIKRHISIYCEATRFRIKKVFLVLFVLT